MARRRVRTAALALGVILAAAVCATGCSKLKKPQETETESVAVTEKVTEKITETESESETELQTDIAYTSQDKSIQITLPDATWKVTQDADEMRVFSSGSDAMISIVHAQNESQMKSTSVSESEDVLKESLGKQYPSADAFEVVEFETATAGSLKTYEYVVKYNATSMWAYCVTYGIFAEKEAYVIQGTVTEDNKALLGEVQKAVESFTVLTNPVFGAVTGGKVQNQSESQTQTESEKDADAELKTLTDYGTSATLYARDAVNIRSTPSTATAENIIGSLNLGDKVTVVGETSQWFKVNVNGNIGYVSKAFLVSQPVTAETPAETTAPTETDREPAADSTKVQAELNSQINYESAATLYTTTDVNVRQQPGTESDQVNVLNSGQAVQVIGETDNWYLVSVGGVTGYISKTYVSSSEPAAGGDTGTGQEPSGGTGDDPSGGTGEAPSTGDGQGGSGEEPSQGTPAANPGTVSGTVTSASMNTIVIKADDGNIYSINTSDAAVDTDDGLYEGLYVSVGVDYANTLPNGDLYATSVSGH